MMGSFHVIAVITLLFVISVLARDESNFVDSNSSELEELSRVMFDEYWQLHLLNHPEEATYLGDHRYDDRLDSHSLKSVEKEKVMLNEFLERSIQMLPLASNGSETQKNLQLFISNLQNKLESLMSGSYLLQLSKFDTPDYALASLVKYINFNTTTDYWNLLSRYRAMEQQIDDYIEVMREGIRTNFTHSNYSLPSPKNYMEKSLEKTPFYEPFLNMSASLSPQEMSEIRENATDTIKNHLLPAFQKLDNFISQEYLSHTRPGIGVGSLPNGEEFYKQSLAFHLTDGNITAREIHAIGLKEVERITLEMKEVIKSLGLKKSIQEMNDFLKHDDTQRFKDEDEVVQTYRDALMNVIPSKLPLLFDYTPSRQLLMESVPKEFSGSGPVAYYMPASADGITPGTFYLDTTNAQKLGKYEVMTLSLHEGLPGHHFQYSYVMDQKDLPDFRKYGSHNSAYVEGWGLYAEFLGYELGLYEDHFQHIGHLNYEIFRACRLVVDTGIHVLGWSRQKAIDYMLENMAMSQIEIEREVDRYITWPGQACSYKYGELKIKQLRKKTEKALGEAFDVKEFHDVILGNQAPLSILELQVDHYINKALSTSS